jgi:hypothetical protein
VERGNRTLAWVAGGGLGLACGLGGVLTGHPLVGLGLAVGLAGGAYLVGRAAGRRAENLLAEAAHIRQKYHCQEPAAGGADTASSLLA